MSSLRGARDSAADLLSTALARAAEHKGVLLACGVPLLLLSSLRALSKRCNTDGYSLETWRHLLQLMREEKIGLGALLGDRDLRTLLYLEGHRAENMRDPYWLEDGELPHVRTSQEAGISKLVTSAQRSALGFHGAQALVHKQMMAEMDEQFAQVGHVKTHLVLVGGGHSHVHVLKMLAMQPIPNTRVTLISKDVMSPYSGMLPGHIAGVYSKEECHLDLLRLARFARVRYIVAEVDEIDYTNKRVHFKPHGGAQRPRLNYDAISINVGSTPGYSLSTPAGFSGAAITPVKPIDEFSDRWTRMLNSPPKTLAIVGGGAGGCELAFAIHQRLNVARQAAEGVQIVLVQSNPQLVPQHGVPTRKLILATMKEKGIQVRLGCKVKGVAQNGDGRSVLQVQAAAGGAASTIVYDQCIWVTGGQAPRWLAKGAPQGLLSDRGDLRVDTYMQSVAAPSVFAGGDCCTIVGHWRPKAGVFAVMAGMALSKNLRAYCLGLHRTRAAESPTTAASDTGGGDTGAMLASKPQLSARVMSASERERELEEYLPQVEFLGLINVGDGTAIASRGESLALRGAWLWLLKDWIDRKWMHQYSGALPCMLDDVKLQPAAGHGPAAGDGAQQLVAMFAAQKTDPNMRCGACACKLGAGVLIAGLKTIRSSETAKRPPLAASGAASQAKPPVVSIDTGIGDDCAILTIRRNDTSASSPDRVKSLHTIDFFKGGVLDMDPYTFGRISAIHAISDIFAMGISAMPGVTTTALSLCAVPLAADTLMGSDFEQMMAGAKEILTAQNECTIVGGHTIEGELSLGFAINSLVEVGDSSASGAAGAPGRALFLKGSVTAGHRILVTKPLGMGVIQAAVMRNACRGSWYKGALDLMARSNQQVAQALQSCGGGAGGVSSATDVTGFGLVGHLLESMQEPNKDAAARGQTVVAVLKASALPVLPGAVELMEMGVYSSLFVKNLTSFAESCAGLDQEDVRMRILFDPQTSGGLLVTMESELVAPFRAALRSLTACSADEEVAWDIGGIAVEAAGASPVRIE